MFQQGVALIIIVFFLSKIIVKKRKKEINNNEFALWIFFWGVVIFAIIFIKKIDSFVANLGFSSSGIEILLYLGIAIIFYFIFRLRLRIEQIERNITKLIREASLGKKE